MADPNNEDNVSDGTDYADLIRNKWFQWLLAAFIVAVFFVSTNGLALLPATAIGMLTLPLVGPYLLAVVLATGLAIAAGALINGINYGLNQLYDSDMNAHPDVKHILKFGIIPAIIAATALYVFFPAITLTVITTLVLMGPMSGSIMAAIMLTGTVWLTASVVDTLHKMATAMFREKNDHSSSAVKPHSQEIIIYPQEIIIANEGEGSELKKYRNGENSIFYFKSPTICINSNLNINFNSQEGYEKIPPQQPSL